MNFFKSVFSDDDPPILASEFHQQELPSSEKGQTRDSDVSYGSESPPDPTPNPTTSGWNFGGLIKTLTTKSESVLETYRRDLQEFGSGLRKEIEAAQGSLGTVGAAIDDLGSSVVKSTAEIISQGKEAILSVDLSLDELSDGNAKGQAGDGSPRVYGRYSRFEAQVRAIQGDIRTYRDEPEDVDDFSEWKLKFDLGKKEVEISALLDENNSVLRSVYEELVPCDVDNETFWCRYFYRVRKLEQAENFRAKLVKSAISREEEELSWDVYDDEEEDEVDNIMVKEKEFDVAKSQPGEDADLEQIANASGDGEVEVEENAKQIDDGDANAAASEPKSKDVIEESVHSEKGSGVGKEDLAPETDKNIADSNMAVKSSKDGEEEDVGWDETEDLSSIDDGKVTRGGTTSPNRAELRKRLSAAEEEEEEDMSWDIEDDDDQAQPSPKP